MKLYFIFIIGANSTVVTNRNYSRSLKSHYCCCADARCYNECTIFFYDQRRATYRKRVLFVQKINDDDRNLIFWLARMRYSDWSNL